MGTLAPLEDIAARLAVTAERVSEPLAGRLLVPIGAYAEWSDRRLAFRRGRGPQVRRSSADEEASVNEPTAAAALGMRLAERLIAEEPVLDGAGVHKAAPRKARPEDAPSRTAAGRPESLTREEDGEHGSAALEQAGATIRSVAFTGRSRRRTAPWPRRWRIASYDWVV
jgi:hypothetical protein